MTAYRVTDAAKLDFRAILKETGEQFGMRQREIYKRLIAKGVEMVAAEPGRGGSWDRGGVVPGLRAFHWSTRPASEERRSTRCTTPWSGCRMVRRAS